MSRIIFFEGDGIIGKAIGAATGSRMSHVAWQTPDGTLWEAVDEGFKATPDDHAAYGDWLAPMRRYHPAGTRIHAFDLALFDKQEEKALEFLESIRDDEYGFRTLFAFMMHPGKDPEPGKVICSEAVLGASIYAGYPLLDRIQPHQCSPRDLYISPRLGRWLGSYTL